MRRVAADGEALAVGEARLLDVDVLVAHRADDAHRLVLRPAGVRVHPDDGVGRLVHLQDANLHSERYEYNGRGDRIKFTNKNGQVWDYTYDSNGRLLTETAPPVAITGVERDARGDLYGTPSTNVRIVTRMTYDALGNLRTRTEAAGLGPKAERTTSYDYDAAGRQVRVTHPPVAVYNEAASAVATNGWAGVASRVESAPVALTTQTFYDVFGNAVANIDVAGNASTSKVKFTVP